MKKKKIKEPKENTSDSRNIQKAITLGKGIVPFDVWLNKKNRTLIEIETYKSCVEMIHNIAEGKEKLHNTILIKNVDGENKLICY
jgi:hypothetical protein